MEPKFSTSFIPKQTLTQSAYHAPKQRAPRGVLSLFFILALIIFIGSAAVAGVVMFNAQILQNSLQSKREQLQRAREAFQPELIRAMTRLDQRLQLATTLLHAHVAPSKIYDALQQYTLGTVRYTTFQYQFSEGVITITMQGEAQSFSSIALQTDEFVRSRVILNPIFTNFTLDENGAVAFSLTANVDPNYVSYEKTVEAGVASGSIVLP